MPRRIQRRVTAREVAALSKRDGRHAIADNLYLAVSGPAASWFFRYQRAGKRHEMGLGPYPLISLARARELAEGHRRALVDGIDPLKERAAAKVAQVKAGHTFEHCALAYIRDMSANWTSDRHAAEWARSVRSHAFPLIGAVPIADVDLPLVLAVLQPLWHTHPETASRVRGRIEVILDWARVRGFREGENPAQMARPSLNAITKKRPRPPGAALPLTTLRRDPGTHGAAA